MISSVSYIKSVLSNNFINIPGWRTNRKIIVIESDDWGSIRMPSNDVFLKFISEGCELAGSLYNQLDTLEANEDLASLYDLLQNYQDFNGHHPIITGNMVMGNPDFGKIRESDFSKYFYEPVTETLKHYPQRDKVETLWKQGDAAGIFHPQFHCREHVNIVRWMSALRTNSTKIRRAFDNETTFSGNGDYNFMEVLDYNSPDDLIVMKESLSDGLNIFDRIFGFRSKSFIPPCYIWDSDIEETLFKSGIKYIQGIVIQSIPTGSFGKYKKKIHFLGNRNSSGQYFLIRNCFFEPALLYSSDPVGECLRQIRTAFRWNKPAIISSHRINYIGTLNEKNRKDNLSFLDQLIIGILKNWPDSEFMTSDQLGDLITVEGRIN